MVAVSTLAGICIGASVAFAVAYFTMLLLRPVPHSAAWDEPLPTTITEDDDELIQYAAWFVFEALEEQA